MRENACYPPGDINIPNTLDFYFQVRITLALDPLCPDWAP